MYVLTHATVEEDDKDFDKEVHKGFDNERNKFRTI